MAEPDVLSIAYVRVVFVAELSLTSCLIPKLPEFPRMIHEDGDHRTCNKGGTWDSVLSADMFTEVLEEL